MDVAAADSEARDLLKRLEEQEAEAAGAVRPAASGPVEDSDASRTIASGRE